MADYGPGPRRSSFENSNIINSYHDEGFEVRNVHFSQNLTWKVFKNESNIFNIVVYWCKCTLLSDSIKSQYNW